MHAPSFPRACDTEASAMNNIAIANETIAITAAGFYELRGRRIDLPKEDYSAVEVWSPEKGAALVAATAIPEDAPCRISVTTEDSFAAARRFDHPLVMNFANAHHAGGGFRLGANAQEEALCRCSTLYASIHSAKAGEMYRWNNTRFSAVASDYMLYSPRVCVFRDPARRLLPHPFMAAVATLPAPNRRGAAIFASRKTIAETMTRRIRILLAVAAHHGHRNLVLGAWGCGAFGNRPDDVSACFRQVLVEEHFGRLFDHVCFAIYGPEDGQNLRAFQTTFPA